MIIVVFLPYQGNKIFGFLSYLFFKTVNLSEDYYDSHIFIFTSNIICNMFHFLRSHLFLNIFILDFYKSVPLNPN